VFGGLAVPGDDIPAKEHAEPQRNRQPHSWHLNGQADQH